MGKKSFLDKLGSAQLIPVGFLSLILLGTLLLLLPFATARGEHTGILTAFFTATTSVCVTGLVVVDTFSHWTLFGKLVILALIQLGGLGVIAVSSAFMLAIHHRISLRDRVLIMDAYNLSSLHGLMAFFGRVLRSTFLVEGLGAVGYMFSFIPRFGTARGIWYSVFTAVSAFCNAGIDIIGPDSLIGFNREPGVLIVTMLLIVVGGLGYVVWFDLAEAARSLWRKKRVRLSEHTRLVLCLTAGLVLGGALLTMATEYTNPATLGGLSFGGKILNALFQSVTFRTAGFAAVPQGALRDSTAVLGAVLMFIGGSPMGTAGGVKTVTLYLLVKNTVSYILGRNETVVFDRRVHPELIREATAIVTVSFAVSGLLTVLLTVTERLVLTPCLYEAVSAVATVGLSQGLTPRLTRLGRVLVAAGMYLGRIGPISMAMFFRTRKQAKNNVRTADGNYLVG